MPSYIGVSPSPELNVSNIANNAITTDKILDATISNADISSSAAIATTKLAYKEGGIWPAIGWVIGWIACFILSNWTAKNL